MEAKGKRILGSALIIALCCGCVTQTTEKHPDQPTQTNLSRVEKTDANERILIQETWFSASIDDVWRAYTTEEGWTAWASPKAKIDLQVGGTIRTAYEGEVGGDNTITLHIVNYVPRRLLTLRTDVSKNWPEIMQKDAAKLSNVILFDEAEPGRTRIQSYGIGYTDAPEYDQLMGFFIQANEGLFDVLRDYLESGRRFDWSN